MSKKKSSFLDFLRKRKSIKDGVVQPVEKPPKDDLPTSAEEESGGVWSPKHWNGATSPSGPFRHSLGVTSPPGSFRRSLGVTSLSAYADVEERRSSNDSVVQTEQTLEDGLRETDPVNLLGTVLRLLCDESMRTQPRWLVCRVEKVLETVRESLDGLPADERARAANLLVRETPPDVHPDLVRRLLDRALSVREFVALQGNPKVQSSTCFRPTDLSPSRSLL